MHTDDTRRIGVRTVVIPEQPRHSGLDAEKVYDVLLVVLGLVGASVSGWSIATLLHTDGGMQWAFAAVGVGVYDLLAFMAGLMVYIRRHEPHRAVGAQAIMLAAIGGSAYVNYMHGRQVGGDLVALVFGAAPVVFEIAFAMRHNVLSVVTSLLFPRAMWRRYRDGVWIKLHTGSLPATSGMVPEASGSASADLPEELPPTFRKPFGVPHHRLRPSFRRLRKLPEVPQALPSVRPDLSGPDNPRTPDAQVTALPEASGMVPEAPEDRAEALPETFRKLPEAPEDRAEAVAEALRRGDKITGTTVGAMYGVSDSMGRAYIRKAKEINAAREDA